MRGSYDFAGDIDEVRVSRVARSADWIKLEYENQKAQQTLVGSSGAAGQCLFGLAGGDQGRGGQERDRHRPGRGRPEGLLDSSSGMARNRRRRGPAIRTPSMPAAWWRTRRLSCSSRRCMPMRSRPANMPVTIKEEIPEPVFYLASARRPGMAGTPSKWCRTSPIWQRCRPKARGT